jgi:hypothetical protein
LSKIEQSASNRSVARLAVQWQHGAVFVEQPGGGLGGNESASAGHLMEFSDQLSARNAFALIPRSAGLFVPQSREEQWK